MSDRILRRLEKKIAASVPAGVEVITPDSRSGWLGQRGKTVGASESPALFGVHPFETFYSLYCRKSGLVGSMVEDTGPVRRGRMLEAVAVEFLREEHHDWVVIANPMPHGRFFRDAAAGLSCTPDAFVWDPLRQGWGLAQIKSVEPTVFRQKWKNEEGEIEPPVHVAVQCVQEAALTGASWVVACPLVIGHGIDMPEIEVPLHRGIMTRLRAEARLFWARVDAGDAPAPDFRTDGATIAALHPDDNGQEIDLSGANDLPGLVDELDALHAAAKAATARADEIKARFRHEIGPHETAILAGGRRASLRTIHKAGAYVEPSTYRALRFSRTGSAQ